MDTLDSNYRLYILKSLYEDIKKTFHYKQTESHNKIKSIAIKVKDSILNIDDFIQKNTSVICRNCEKVCCINKHGYYEFEDLIFLNAINESLPKYREGIVDEEPCQFLTSHGCTLDRFIRPFRCNWYFCIPLINHMQNQKGKDLRRFENTLQQIIDDRREMVGIYIKFNPNTAIRMGSEVNSDVLAAVLCDMSVKQPQVFEPEETGSPKSHKTFWGGS